jgi:riboflavin transporter FmnP
MGKKCIISAVVMAVMSFLLAFLIHGGLLQADYAKYPNLMRPMAEVQAKLPFLALGHIFIGTAFAYIYFQGKEDKPWLMQGLRYSVAVCFLTVIPFYLINYAVVPVTLALALKEMAYDAIRIVLMGIALAWINR